MREHKRFMLNVSPPFAVVLFLMNRQKLFHVVICSSGPQGSVSENSEEGAILFPDMVRGENRAKGVELMAATFSRHTVEKARKHARIARCYKTIIAWMRGESSPKKRGAVHSDLPANGATPEWQAREESEEKDFAQWGKCSGQQFSEEELRMIRHLRSAYQNGGSDRAEIIRSLNFVKYLLSRGQIRL
jgi:hypothetical protein